MSPTPALTRRQILRIGVPVAMAALGVAGGTGCAGRTRGPVEPSDPLPPDQVVFSVQGWPGLAPPIFLALALPELVVYGSGAVMWPELNEGVHGAPPHVLSADVDPLAVAGSPPRPPRPGCSPPRSTTVAYPRRTSARPR